MAKSQKTWPEQLELTRTRRNQYEKAYHDTGESINLINLINSNAIRTSGTEEPEELKAVKAIQLDYCLKAEKLAQEYQQLIKQVEKLDDLEEKIIIKRYIEGKALKEIADELFYSYSYTRKLHAKAIQGLDGNRRA